MLIGIDARNLTKPELRGMASYLLELLKVWPESKDEFCLFTEDEPRPEALITPAHAEWIQVIAPRGSRLHIWDWWALPKMVRKMDIDVFWSPANRTYPFSNPPQIATVHDTLLQERVQYSSPIDKLYFHRVIPALCRRYACRVITVSQFSAGCINKTFGYPNSKIRVIYNGATLPVKQFNTPQEARKYLAEKQLAKGKFIYALGAESPWKNTERMLKAFKIIRSLVSDLSLVISGIQERSRHFFEKLCENLGLQDGSVRLFGFVSPDIRNAFFQGAEVFVYPSLFEGFGLPSIEAMALGTPVVASQAASIPEVVGNAALMVDATNVTALADAVVKMLEDKNLCQEYIQRGTENICRFSWHTSAREHRRVMEEVIAE